MKFPFVVFSFLIYTTGTAQKVVDVTKNETIGPNTFFSVGGEPFVTAKFVHLRAGSPFFKDEWLKGKGVGEAGQVYSNGTIKLNLLDNQIIFLNAQGAEMISSIPLKELSLVDSVGGRTYHFVSSTTLPASAKKGWYLQLANGKASLYQFFNKQIREEKPYGSATTEQSILTKEEFFVSLNGVLVQVKKPKELPAILTDKKKELEALLSKDDIKDISAAEQLKTLVGYYNTLQ